MTRLPTLSRRALFLGVSMSILFVVLWNPSHRIKRWSMANKSAPGSMTTNAMTSLLDAMSSVARNTKESAPPITYILPLGDSITQGSGVPGGYRGKLYERLGALGYDVTYLGTKKKNCFGDCTMKQKWHEGHGGRMLTVFIDSIEKWLGTYIHEPDLILMMVGTTEFADRAYDVEGAIDRWDELIEKVATLQPHANIIASNIIDRAERWNDNIHEFFNPYVEDIVKKHAAAGRRVTFVDMHSAIPANLLSDSLHPNDHGYDIMADKWVDAIQKVTGPNGDKLPPAIINVRVSNDLTRVFVTFSKPISDDSVLKPKSFVMPDKVSVLSVELDSSYRQITLTTSGLKYEGDYTLKLTSVTDRTSAKIPLANDTLKFSGPVQPTGTLSPTPSGTHRLPHSSCKDQQGKFDNPNGIKRECVDLDTSYKLERNCGTVDFPRSELGAECPEACSEYYTCQTKSLTDAPEHSPTPQPSRNPTKSPSKSPVKPPTKSPVNPPTMSPIESCTDSKDKFRISKKDGRRDCSFVATDPKFCTWTHIQEFCPVTCNQCPKPSCKDTPGDFYVADIDKNRSCAFIKKDLEKFCNWSLYKSKCPETCGQCNTDSPTKAPTEKPNEACADTKDTFSINAKYGRKGCSFVATESKFCDWKFIQDFCPVTCQKCTPASCKDNSEPFYVASLDKNRSCPFIQKDVAKFCKWSLYKTNCPETCGQCNTGNDPPVASPTKAPTVNHDEACADTKSTFGINTKYGHQNCSFVANETKFCNWKFIQDFCPVTCGKCTPTACKDNSEPFYVPSADDNRSCAFIQKDVANFCKWKLFSSNCPETCGQCNTDNDSPDEACTDTKETFAINNIYGRKGCNFVATETKFCNWKFIQDFCPVTCGKCT